MNYKKMLMIALLLPAVEYGNDNVCDKNKRIEELECTKFKMEWEAVDLSTRLLKEQKKAVSHRMGLIDHYWKPKDKNRQEALEGFAHFTTEFADAFDRGEDTVTIVNKAPFVVTDNTNLHLMCIRFIIHQLVVNRMTVQYERLVNQLAMVNKEIATLKS